MIIAYIRQRPNKFRKSIKHGGLDWVLFEKLDKTNYGEQLRDHLIFDANTDLLKGIKGKNAKQ